MGCEEEVIFDLLTGMGVISPEEQEHVITMMVDDTTYFIPSCSYRVKWDDEQETFCTGKLLGCEPDSKEGYQFEGDSDKIYSLEDALKFVVEKLKRENKIDPSAPEE